jgi:hypothetical protein
VRLKLEMNYGGIKMKKILLLLVLLLLVVGCTTGVTEDAMEEQLEAEGGEAEVEIDGEDVYIEYSDGENEIIIDGNTGDNDWCMGNAAWNMQVTGEDGTVSTWVSEFEDSGEYEGLCHLTFTSEGPEGSSLVETWYTEDGAVSHTEITNDGETVTMDYNF